MIQDLGSPTQEARWRHLTRVALSSDAGIRPRQTIPPLTNPAGASSKLFFLARVQPRHRVSTRGPVCPPRGTDRCHERTTESNCSGRQLAIDAACPPHVPRPPALSTPEGKLRYSPQPRLSRDLDTGGSVALERNRIV